MVEGRLRLAEAGRPRAEAAVLADAGALLGAEPAGLEWVLDIRVRQQTAAEVARLGAQLEKTRTEFAALEAATPEALWVGDLAELDRAIELSCT